MHDPLHLGIIVFIHFAFLLFWRCLLGHDLLHIVILLTVRIFLFQFPVRVIITLAIAVALAPHLVIGE